MIQTCLLTKKCMISGKVFEEILNRSGVILVDDILQDCLAHRKGRVAKQLAKDCIVVIIHIDVSSGCSSSVSGFEENNTFQGVAFANNRCNEKNMVASVKNITGSNITADATRLVKLTIHSGGRFSGDSDAGNTQPG